ncbi:MAG: hypothetical protein ACOC1O_05865 [bacterium]
MPKEAERLVSKIKSDLRKEHPDWSKDRINSIAHATVTKIYKKQGKPLPFK